MVLKKLKEIKVDPEENSIPFPVKLINDLHTSGLFVFIFILGNLLNQYFSFPFIQLPSHSKLL